MSTQAEKEIPFARFMYQVAHLSSPIPGMLERLDCWHLGFEALATTSAGYAFSVGQRDNTIDGDKMMTHVAEIVSATKRISVGSALSRAALGAFLREAREMKTHGTFTFADEAVTSGEIGAMFNA